jgi:hypothetical protein
VIRFPYTKNPVPNSYDFIPISIEKYIISGSVRPLKLAYTFCCFQWTCPVDIPYIPHAKSHVHSPSLRSFLRILPSPRPCVTFRNMLIFLWWRAPRPNPNPLLAVCDCLFSIFAVAFHIWGPFPPCTTWGHAVPWY